MIRPMRRPTGTWSLVSMTAAALLLAATPSAQAQSGTVDVRIGTASIALAGGTVPAVLVDATSASSVSLTISSGDTSVAVTHGAGVTLTTPSDGRCRFRGTTSASVVTCPLEGLRGLRVTAGSGNDRVDASRFTSTAIHADLRGGEGDDELLTGNPVTSRLEGGPGNDVLRNAGSARADVLGGTGSDQLLGGDGFDILVGGAGSDLLNGGAGTGDTASYVGDGVTRGAAGITATLGDGLCNDGGTADAAIEGAAAPGCLANGADRDRIVNVEVVSGSAGPDDITGSDAPETLGGNDGADRIEGGGGPDRLLGDLGIDLLLARDGLVDTTVACGRETERVDGDRAVTDPDDIVHPSCTTVERGGAGVGGPIGSSNGLAGSPPDSPPAPPGSPPPPLAVGVPEGTLLPAQPPGLPVTPDVPPTRAEGTGPGGGDNGRTAPELQITSPVATVDRRGRVAVRVRCVYRAKACTGTVTLTSSRTVSVRRKNRRTLRVARGAVLARATLSIPWGRSAPVRLALRGSAKTILASGKRSLRARAEVRARDSEAPRGKEARVRRQVVIGGR